MGELLYIAFWIVAAVTYSSLWVRVYTLHQKEGGDSISVFPPSMLVWSHSAFLVIQPYFFLGIVGAFFFHLYSERRAAMKKCEGADVWWNYGYYVERFQNINGIIVEWPVQLAATNLVGARGGSMRERK